MTRAHHAGELFSSFFESGMEESISPFLTPSSRAWGKNIPLRASLLAAACLVISALLAFFPGYRSLSHFALLLTYFFAGIPSLIGAIEDLCSFEINLDVLMVLAAFSSVFIGSGYEGGLLLVLFAFSSSLESVVSGKAKKALQALKALSPSRAYVVQGDGTLLERSVKDITPGTHILVKAGQVVPLDGKIMQGSSSINLVHLTGENTPHACKEGDHVQAGGSNIDGSLLLEVTHTSSESTLSRIIQLINKAASSKPKLQRWFDSLTNRYALGVIIFSGIVALSLPLFTTIPFLGHGGSIYRAVAFLIAASPCALILAIPIAYLSAMSACARSGILLKGGIVLDALTRCRTLALDKTGTLTTGELICHSLHSDNPHEALSIAYALEQHVEHPIAKAICAYGASEKALPILIDQVKVVPGCGVEATVEGKHVAIGSYEWMLPKADLTHLQPFIHTAKEEGRSLAVLVTDNQASLFVLSDQLREGVSSTLECLQKHWKIDPIMLTGDHLKSAKRIAKAAGITKVEADLKPEDKLSWIETLSAKKEGLVMVGDGINDAPALARASVGIAMGGIGTHTASSAADIILLHDRIDHLDWLIKKAHQTTKIVTQNLLLASGAIVLAVVPALLGFIPLWLAVLLHEGGTVIVGMNALRLLRGHGERKSRRDSA